MEDLDQAALDAAEDRGQYLLPRELLTFIERFDPNVERGVPLARLEAYAETLNDRGVQSVEAAQLDELVADDLTDAESWAGPDAIYEVGDGLSAFPPRWHDELSGEDDLLEYVDLIGSELASSENHTATGAAGDGVPQQLFLDVASVMSPYSRDGVKSRIERLRGEGILEEPADQHPEARVRRAQE